MVSKYRQLNKEIFEKGIKRKAIANYLGISTRALKNKMDGIAPFTWEQVCKIQKQFFPEISKDILFSTEKHQKSA